MKIAVISFTRRGAETAVTIENGLVRRGAGIPRHSGGESDCVAAEGNAEFSDGAIAPPFTPTTVSLFTMKKDLGEDVGRQVAEGLDQWAEKAFQNSDAIVFVGAAGIAVRAIAAHIKSKETDPAVIVVDELGIHVISLLSGHIGGANKLTLAIAEILQARPVITTATDINGLFSVDQWAAERNLTISDMKQAKEVAARLLSGMPVGFYSDVPVCGDVPKGLVMCGFDGVPLATRQEPLSLGIAVTWRQSCKPFQETLQLVPQMVSLGMGCRKNIPVKNVEVLLQEVLVTGDISQAALEKIASIDLKEEEAALLAAAKARGIPFQVFTAEELAGAPGRFSPSGFVKSVTGVDNVCERAAVLGSGGGSLILNKLAKDGVTAAVAIRNIELTF